WDAIAPNSADLSDAAAASGAKLGTFFAEMAATRKFFAPLIDSSATGRTPQYDFQVDFRVNRPKEVAANQIAEWSADIGGQHVEIGALPAARRGRWRASDSVEVTLRWATGSAFSPAAVVGPAGVVREGMVTLAAGGTWSVLRLLKAFES